MTYLPPLKQVPSPNFSERGVPLDLIVIHDCEGSYAGSINVFLTQNGQRSVSAHLVLNDDGSEATQMVPFAKKAWHAVNFNSRSIGIEMAGFTAKGFAPSELNADAHIVAWLLKKFNIPCRWARGGAGPGFCSHYDLGADGGGHSDPTTDAKVWQGYVNRVTAAYKLLDGVPLPDWGLDSAPQPQVVTAPPAAPANFTPSGTVRQDAADADSSIHIPDWPASPDDPFFVLGARAINKWRQYGVPNTFIFAKLAAGEAECSLNVGAVGDHGQAHGLGQWWGDRIAKILAGTHIDVTTDKVIEHHIAAMWWEMNNMEHVALEKVLLATTAFDAAVADTVYYERAGASGAAQRRGRMAERWTVWAASDKGKAMIAAHLAQP